MYVHKYSRQISAVHEASFATELLFLFRLRSPSGRGGGGDSDPYLTHSGTDLQKKCTFVRSSLGLHVRVLSIAEREETETETESERKREIERERERRKWTTR